MATLLRLLLQHSTLQPSDITNDDTDGDLFTYAWTIAADVDQALSLQPQRPNEILLPKPDVNPRKELLSPPYRKWN